MSDDPYDMSCHHCGVDCIFGDDYFMVTDEVWYDEAGLGWDDFLCRGCLMSVLGRELTEHDYTPCLLNSDILTLEHGWDTKKISEAWKKGYTHRPYPGLRVA